MLLAAPVLLILQQAVERVAMPDTSVDSFDLAKVKTTDHGCADTSGGADIVVCGNHKAMDLDISRLPTFAEKPVRAGAELPGGGRVSVEGESVMIGGAKSNRAMVKLKLPF